MRTAKIRRKKAVTAMMVYIVLTAGIWMFLFAYTNSYNRLTEDKIVPASFVVRADRAEISVLEHSFEISLGVISPDNKLYLVAYLLSPDELRGELLIGSNARYLYGAAYASAFTLC